MVDLAAFGARVRGMLVAPDTTFLRDGRPPPPWRVVAREHALPLVVASAVMAAVLLLLFPPELPDGGRVRIGLDDALLNLVFQIVVDGLALLVMAGVVMFYASRLGGSPRFDASFVLVALAMTPLLLAQALVLIPAVGLAIGVAGLVYSYVLLYRGLIPVVDVPPQNRARVFGLILVTLFAIFLAIGLLLLTFLMPGRA